MPACHQERVATMSSPISLALSEAAVEFSNDQKNIQETYDTLGRVVESLVFDIDLSIIEIQAKELEADVYLVKLNQAIRKYKSDMDCVDVTVFAAMLMTCGCEVSAANEISGQFLVDLKEEYEYVSGLLVDIESVLERGKRSWENVRDDIIDSVISSEVENEP